MYLYCLTVHQSLLELEKSSSSTLERVSELEHRLNEANTEIAALRSAQEGSEYALSEELHSAKKRVAELEESLVGVEFELEVGSRLTSSMLNTD